MFGTLITSNGLSLIVLSSENIKHKQLKSYLNKVYFVNSDDAKEHLTFKTLGADKGIFRYKQITGTFQDIGIITC